MIYTTRRKCGSFRLWLYHRWLLHVGRDDPYGQWIRRGSRIFGFEFESLYWSGVRLDDETLFEKTKNFLSGSSSGSSVIVCRKMDKEELKARGLN